MTRHPYEALTPDVVADALAAQPWGLGVHREQRYPADRARRRESEGERCDFVLTPDGRPLAAPDDSTVLPPTPPQAQTLPRRSTQAAPRSGENRKSVV